MMAFLPLYFDLLSANPTKWSNTLKQFISNSLRIVWVCLTILLGWRLKGYLLNNTEKDWNKEKYRPYVN